MSKFAPSMPRGSVILEAFRGESKRKIDPSGRRISIEAATILDLAIELSAL
jgi:hypothetical protein